MINKDFMIIKAILIFHQELFVEIRKRFEGCKRSRNDNRFLSLAVRMIEVAETIRIVKAIRTSGIAEMIRIVKAIRMNEIAEVIKIVEAIEISELRKIMMRV